MHRGEAAREKGNEEVGRVAGSVQPRCRGKASCISQICRVIKLIKRLTHLTLLPPFRFTLPPFLPSSLFLAYAVSLLYH